MKYVLFQWPESQEIMEKPWFNECLFVQDIEGHDSVGDSAWMVPADRAEELIRETTKNNPLT